MGRSFIIVAFLLFVNKYCVAQDQYSERFNRRVEEISKVTDKWIFFIRGHSGGYSDRNGYILYDLNGKLRLEYYSWDMEGKLISKFKTRKKQREIYAAFRFAIDNYDSLQRYNGKDVYLETEAKKRNDTATNGRVYTPEQSHYGYYRYGLRMEGKYLFSTLTLQTDLKYYIHTAPMLV
jgi:hypothetical protein